MAPKNLITLHPMRDRDTLWGVVSITASQEQRKRPLSALKSKICDRDSAY